MRMRRNSVNFCFRSKKLLSTSCSATTISYESTEIVAIRQHRKRILCIFSPRIHRNSNLGTSCQNLTPPFAPATSISYCDRCISATEWGLLHIFDVFVLLCVVWPFYLDLWPFDFVSCTAFLIFDSHTNFYYPTTIVSELRVLNIRSYFCYLKQTLRMHRVTWPLTGGKNSLHFWNPWPHCTYSLWHFRALQRRLSHVIGKK